MFYKIIGSNRGNFPYHMGLNTLAENGEVFNPDVECGPGGLYFFELADMGVWMDYGTTLCEVTVPDGAQVVKYSGKYKADMICIEKKYDLEDIQTWDYLAEKGLDISTVTESDAFWNSARKNVESVMHLIALSQHDEYLYDEALYWAIRSDCTEVAQCVWETGKCSPLNCALTIAAEHNRFEISKFLVERGASRSDIRLAIAQADVSGHFELKKYLIDKFHCCNSARPSRTAPADSAKPDLG